MKRSPVKRKVLGGWFAVTDLVRNWRYSVPLAINLSGSLWFFLLVGGSGKFSFLLFLLVFRGETRGKTRIKGAGFGKGRRKC